MRTDRADISQGGRKTNRQRKAERERQNKSTGEEPFDAGDDLLDEAEGSSEMYDALFDEGEESAGGPDEILNETESFSDEPEELFDETEDDDIEDNRTEGTLEDLGDLDPEEAEEEAGEWNEEAEWEEETEPQKLWKTAVVFLGLIAAAAAICAVLWHFSHSEDSEDQGQASGSVSQSASESDESVSASQSTDAPESSDAPDEPMREPISGTKDMEFAAVEQSVTPKDVINLRSVPDTTDTGNIVTQVQNGQVLSRTGINEETGWSEIEYEGRTLYGVSQFLTLDLNYKPSVDVSDANRVSTKDGRVIIFVDCDDWISPKEYVNLRTEPSTSEGSATVSCQLNYGEKVHRTGLSPDSGWSRIEYNDQVLYVVTSLMLAEEE